VKSSIQQSTTTATGVVVPANVENSFAVTQATWRFFANERVTPTALVEPLRHLAQQQLVDAKYVLAVTDWSKIDYKKHTAKEDIVQLTHKHDVGYELTTQLLVDAGCGRPIAPIQMHLKTADGFLSTAETAPSADDHHLTQVLPLMQNAAAMNLSAQIVHIIDREADSVYHFREWHAGGFRFLVRSDDNRLVRWRGELVHYDYIVAQLDAEGAFCKSREVSIKGKPGIQYVAETEIVLDRPAMRSVNGRPVAVPGEAITLRLVMARVVDPITGEVLSTWQLLSNVLADVSAETLALWYYWRWNIESYFKLMKSGGQQLEHWQQESGLAVLKRLLVASMASAVVWSLQRSEDGESESFKQVLVRLSGKRLKRGRPPTAGILLSGLFVLLQMFDFLERMDFDPVKIAQLKNTAKKLLPTFKKDV
jgi:hypothetical protein